MASPPAQDIAGQMQKGYRTVPILETDKGAALRLCAVVRTAPDPVAGVFVLLRDGVEASVYLGCLVDAGGYVHEWLELWVQNISNFQTAPEAYRGIVSDDVLDQRWKKRAAFLARLDRPGGIEMDFERVHPPPIYFDPAVSGPVNPKDTEPAKQAPGPLIPFNPGGGLMMLRKFAPIGFEEYLDLLGGHPWEGLGVKAFRLSGVYRTLRNAGVIEHGGAHLFLGKRGGPGRLVETFYLKLDLVLQAFRAVRDFVFEVQVPFLNLSAESFRVALAGTSSSLPFLWTAKVSMATLGSAFALPIDTGDARYFVPDAGGGASIYRPAAPSAPVKGAGVVRIREVLAQEDNSVVLEGTLATQEGTAIPETDLLWIRLTLSSGRVDFYANYFTEAAEHSERRFRTLPRALPEHIVFAIRSAAGVRLSSVPFETVPMQSSPCDLYSLAVIAVRALLVNDENTLSTAIDEVSSLAQAIDAREGGDVSSRLRAIAAADSRWSAALGPQRLLKAGSVSAEEALAYLPAELWWDALAVLVQCFPGATRDAFCPDLGGAPPLALHSVFDPAILALEKISLRSRSLLFVDWKYNSEVSAVIKAALQRHRAQTG